MDTAYEIHHGVATPVAPGAAEPFPDGYRSGAVWVTTGHGGWENDAFRRAFLRHVAATAGRDSTPASGISVARCAAGRLDALGDLIADHLDTDVLESLIVSGPPTGLPFIPPGARA